MNWLEKNMTELVMIVLSINPTRKHSSSSEVVELIATVLSPPTKMFTDEVTILPVFQIKVVHDVADFYDCLGMTNSLTTVM